MLAVLSRRCHLASEFVFLIMVTHLRKSVYLIHYATVEPECQLSERFVVKNRCVRQSDQNLLLGRLSKKELQKCMRNFAYVFTTATERNRIYLLQTVAEVTEDCYMKRIENIPAVFLLFVSAALTFFFAVL